MGAADVRAWIVHVSVGMLTIACGAGWHGSQRSPVSLRIHEARALRQAAEQAPTAPTGPDLTIDDVFGL